jgi:hypothetical protein
MPLSLLSAGALVGFRHGLASRRKPVAVETKIWSPGTRSRCQPGTGGENVVEAMEALFERAISL